MSGGVRLCVSLGFERVQGVHVAILLLRPTLERWCGGQNLHNNRNVSIVSVSRCCLDSFPADRRNA